MWFKEVKEQIKIKYLCQRVEIIEWLKDYVSEDDRQSREESESFGGGTITNQVTEFISQF